MNERLAELKAQKDLVEAEIAYGDVTAGRAASTELARIKREIELLSARKQLTELGPVVLPEVAEQSSTL